MDVVREPTLIGRRIAGKFLIDKRLGDGSMGAVYRARDEALDRRVALKVMLPAMAVDPSFVRRFHREARAACRLDHPSSLRVIEFGEEPDGLLYIAMEYLEGRDLFTVIHEDWPLPEERIADVMMKALSALAVAHEMGVIHRDLKPENIMVLDRKDDDGRDLVKVCDFGIAKIVEKDDDAPNESPKTIGPKVTGAGMLVGTPEYMSPEQARGEPLDARSDLYAMGILLYQLLTGRTPFMAESPIAVVFKQISDEPELPRTIYPDVHQGLETVCMRALAKDRGERFQSARAMRAAIKAAIEGTPVVEEAELAPAEVLAIDPAAPNGAVEPVKPTDRTTSYRVIFAVLAFVTIAAGGAAIVVGGGGARPAPEAEAEVAPPTEESEAEAVAAEVPAITIAPAASESLPASIEALPDASASVAAPETPDGEAKASSNVRPKAKPSKRAAPKKAGAARAPK